MLATKIPYSRVDAVTPTPAAVTAPPTRIDTGTFGSRTNDRITALDFTKGALVLVMVLYHWLNYFVVGHDSIYTYLRFLPTSFTFISGFLISQVYLSKYESTGLMIPKRLLLRGLKLMAIAAFLNLAPNLIRPGVFRMRVGEWSFRDFAWDFLTGARPVAFSVLVPIAYLLILCAGLFFISRFLRGIYYVVCIILVGCAATCDVAAINSGYLQILSLGMLGVSIGRIPIDHINRVTAHPWTIAVLYIAYSAALRVVIDSYVVQTVGVLLNLSVIFWLGSQSMERRFVGRIVILLGQYSLFAYIIQILILQILRGDLRGIHLGVGLSSAVFVLCVLCTIASVKALEFSRHKSSTVNMIYRAVFN